MIPAMLFPENNYIFTAYAPYAAKKRIERKKKGLCMDFSHCAVFFSWVNFLISSI